MSLLRKLESFFVGGSQQSINQVKQDGDIQTTSVEIKTGKRRVIDYMLSPLKRHSTEALRER